MKWIIVKGDMYNEEAIGFIRRLNKRPPTTNGSKTPAYYVMQLKDGYSLDGRGKIRSIFLTREEGESVLNQLGILSKEQEDAARGTPAGPTYG